MNKVRILYLANEINHQCDRALVNTAKLHANIDEWHRVEMADHAQTSTLLQTMYDNIDLFARDLSAHRADTEAQARLNEESK
jgi:hypothetical protein